MIPIQNYVLDQGSLIGSETRRQKVKMRMAGRGIIDEENLIETIRSPGEDFQTSFFRI